MTVRKRLLLSSSILVLLIIALSGGASKKAPLAHGSFNAKYADIIANSVSLLESEQESYDFKVGVVSHHLPTAAHMIARFYGVVAESHDSIERVVVIGPDHTESCANHISVTDRGYETIYGRLKIDESYVSNLLDAGANLEPDCFEKEHSIGAQVDYIKYFYPNADLVAVSLSASTPTELLEPMVEQLSNNSSKSLFIISVDLNHYRTKEIADSVDAETIDMIKDFDLESLNLVNVDSPPSLRLGMLLAQELGYTNPVVLEKANSADWGGAASNTTGYVSLVFAKD